MLTVSYVAHRSWHPTMRTMPYPTKHMHRQSQKWTPGMRLATKILKSSSAVSIGYRLVQKRSCLT